MTFIDSNHAHGMQAALAHWREAFGLAHTIVRDAGRAEELCQEALLKLGTASRPLDVEASVRGLFLLAVRHLAISDLRRRRPEALDRPPESVPDPRGQEPMEHAQRTEQTAAVRDALDRLRPMWRTALYLRDGLGLSYKEIAAVAGLTEDVVRVTLHRARTRMRELLSVSLKGEQP